MIFLNRYNKNIYAKRYKKYKILFFIYFSLFCLALVLGLTEFGGFLALNSGFFVNQSIKTGAVISKWLILFSDELPLFLILLATGITVYAPIAGAGAAFYRGIICGLSARYLWLAFKSGQTISILLADLLFNLLCGQLLCVWGAFCSCVAFRIFTDKLNGSVRDEETRMFGGTLFNSLLFRNTVNLRFLFSYLLIFAAILSALNLICLAFTLLLCLF